MKEITAVKINPTDFAPFGNYCSMTEPEGYPLQGEIHKFYPDQLFQRRPHESTKQCLDKACQGSEYFPEETIH